MQNRRERARRGAALAAVAAAGLVLAACATVGRTVFREPVVTLKEARITGLGLAGGTIEVVVAVYNPNRFRLDGSCLTYAIAIDTIPFGSGSHDARFTVERGDTTDVTLPLSFTYAGVGAAGRQLMQTGSVEYTVTGDVTVGTPLGQFTRPYTGRGRFSTLSRR